ncbi:MAG: transcription antitermination factor NusB [Verrucomicrobiales bacterium]
MPSARQLALDLLLQWDKSDAYADALLAEVDRRRPLCAADRALLQGLVFGVLRHASLLDHWIDHLRGRGRLRAGPRWILRLGLYQLLKLEVPAHAAVNETVRLAGREKSLINAILRRALREKEQLLALADQAPPAIRHSLPKFLVDRWVARFGFEDFERLSRIVNQPAEIFVRLNRLKADVGPPAGESVDAAPDFYRVKTIPRELLRTGHGYVQDPSTAVAPALLAPRSGETVLDAFAAPGGKSAIMAQTMENGGRLVASDASLSRLERLQENLARLGVTCAELRLIDWSEPAPADFPLCDAILLDVPCSNTGVMRRRVDVRWRVTPDTIRKMAEMQFSLLKNVALVLKPGGRLVYSTCSIEPEENELQIQRLQKEFPHLRLIESCLLLPHKTGFDGGFAALFVADG